MNSPARCSNPLGRPRALLKAVKSPGREQHRAAMKLWLAAQQRRRDVWRAMATPLSVDDQENRPPND